MKSDTFEPGAKVRAIAYVGSALFEAMITEQYIQGLIDMGGIIEGAMRIRPKEVEMITARGEHSMRYTVQVEGVVVE